MHLLHELSLLCRGQPWVVVDLIDHLHLPTLVILLLSLLLVVLKLLLFLQHKLGLDADILVLLLLLLVLVELGQLVCSFLIVSLHEAFLVTRGLHAIEHLILVKALAH